MLPAAQPWAHRGLVRADGWSGTDCSANTATGTHYTNASGANFCSNAASSTDPCAHKPCGTHVGYPGGPSYDNADSCTNTSNPPKAGAYGCSCNFQDGYIATTDKKHCCEISPANAPMQCAAWVLRASTDIGSAMPPLQAKIPTNALTVCRSLIGSPRLKNRPM